MATAAITNNKLIVDSCVSGSITINNNDRGVFSIDVTKSGYTPVGIIGIDLSNNWMFLGGFSVSGNNAQIIIHNRSGSAGSQTVAAKVLYQKT